VQFGAMSVNGNLEEKQGRCNQSLGGRGDTRSVGGDSDGKMQSGRGGDDVRRAFVQHGFAAPEIHDRPVAVSVEIPDYVDIPFGGDFLPETLLEILPVHETAFAPLAACRAAQIATVGHAKAELAYFVAPALIPANVKGVEQVFCRLKAGKPRGNPGMAEHLQGQAGHGLQTDCAAFHRIRLFLKKKFLSTPKTKQASFPENRCCRTAFVRSPFPPGRGFRLIPRSFRKFIPHIRLPIKNKITALSIFAGRLTASRLPVLYIVASPVG